MGVTEDSSSSALPPPEILKRRRIERLPSPCRGPRESPLENTSVRVLSLDEVKDFTDGFSESNCLGETDSTYSMVYRGRIAIDRERNLFKDVIVETWKLSRANKNIWEAQHRLLHDPIISSHPNVVKLYGYCREGQFLGFVYDCEALGTVRTMYGDDQFTWTRRIRVALLVADVLNRLHSQGIVVCNLEPGSILLDKDFIPVVFGLGKASGGYLGKRSTVGHPIIISAYEFSDIRFSARGCIDPSCDVYSFGALLVTLITKSATTAEYISPLKSFIQEVFGTDDFSLLSYTQQQVQTCFGADEDYNPHHGTCIMELAMQCVHKDPTQRPPICEVVNRLKACF